MKTKVKIIISILLVLAWMLVIYTFSNMPSSESNSKSKIIISKIIKDDNLVEKLNKPFRKCTHASVYFVLSIIIMCATIQIKDKKLLVFNFTAILICFLFACTDEFHQLFVDGRTGQFIDVIIDTCGAILGCSIFDLIYRLFSKNIYKLI